MKKKSILKTCWPDSQRVQTYGCGCLKHQKSVPSSCSLQCYTTAVTTSHYCYLSITSMKINIPGGYDFIQRHPNSNCDLGVFDYLYAHKQTNQINSLQRININLRNTSTVCVCVCNSAQLLIGIHLQPSGSTLPSVFLFLSLSLPHANLLPQQRRANQ